MISTSASKDQMTCSKEDPANGLDASSTDLIQVLATMEDGKFSLSPKQQTTRPAASSTAALESQTSHTTTSSPTNAEAQRRVAAASVTTATGIRSVSDHTPNGWEQPEWAKERKLRPTMAASTSAQPSTANKKIEWERPDWTVKPLLKESSSGHQAKTTGDLQKPITKATDKETNRGTLDDFNVEANPTSLRPTQQGSAVRLGRDLAKSITMVDKDPFSDVNFEANPSFVLRDTPIGQAVKQGTSLSKPVTHCYKPDSMGVNFSVNPAFLKPTHKGKVAKTKGDLQKPITAATITKGDIDSLNLEANPMILKPTEKGSLVRLGEKLELPITHIKEAMCGAASMHDVNFDANETMLKSSERGKSIKHGKDLSRPITFINGRPSDTREENDSDSSDGEGQWEDFAPQETPSHSSALEGEEDDDQHSYSGKIVECAFNNSFGLDSKSLIVDS